VSGAAARSAPWRLVDALLRGWRGLPTIVRCGGVAAVMAFLWWSSSRTPAPEAPFDPVVALLGNAAHFVAYFGLSLAAWLAAPAVMPSRRLDAVALAVAVAYGAVDEWHQSWVPGRTASVVDLVTDLFGAAFAIWFVRFRLGGGPASWRRGAALAVCGAAAATLATFGPW
jgi:VanZ family protein